MAQERLGFIGLGNMGRPMAGRLLDAGHEITAYDINEAALAAVVARGAHRAASPAAVASAAEIVMASLPTPDVVRAVALGEGGVAGGSRVKTFVDLSTTGPRVAKAVAEGLATRGITAVDAPVSGGVTGAAKGTLAVMYSGPKELFERLRPILKNLGNPFFIGERPGMGQMMKIANNLLSATALAATSEALVLGVKAGLDARVMIDVLNAGSGRNSATDDKFPNRILPRTFPKSFTTALMHKDVKLCLDEAEALGVPMFVGNAVRQMVMVAEAMLGSSAEICEIVKCVEAWAGGVEVKG